jgi:hypothetical protein
VRTRGIKRRRGRFRGNEQLPLAVFIAERHRIIAVVWSAERVERSDCFFESVEPMDLKARP